jgi:hypothetical protein
VGPMESGFGFTAIHFYSFCPNTVALDHFPQNEAGATLLACERMDRESLLTVDYMAVPQPPVGIDNKLGICTRQASAALVRS